MTTINFADVIDNIREALSEADGDYVAKIHNKISSSKIKYVGDSIWEVIK